MRCVKTKDRYNNDKTECPRGEIGRHKGLKFNLSALSENLKVKLVKFGEGLTANTEPRHSDV